MSTTTIVPAQVYTTPDVEKLLNADIWDETKENDQGIQTLTVKDKLLSTPNRIIKTFEPTVEVRPTENICILYGDYPLTEFASTLKLHEDIQLTEYGYTHQEVCDFVRNSTEVLAINTPLEITNPIAKLQDGDSFPITAAKFRENVNEESGVIIFKDGLIKIHCTEDTFRTHIYNTLTEIITDN